MKSRRPIRDKAIRLPLLALAAAAIALSGCDSSGGGVELGAPLPAFTVKSLETGGKGFNSDDAKGKVVLIDFWATWCEPCKMSMPEIQKLANKFGPRGLQVVAISDEKPDSIRDFLKDQAFTYPFYIDSDKSANKALGVSSLPTTLLIGKDGKVIMKWVGYAPEVDQELESAIEKAL